MKQIFTTIVTLLTFVAQAQNFTPGNIVLLRVGNGSTTLGSNTAPISLLEFNPITQNQASPTFSVSISSSGIDKITTGGTVQAEGQLSLSQDGRFLCFIGYNQLVGSSTAQSDKNIVIGAVDYAGNIDYSTKYTVNNAGSARSVVSTDGSKFWANVTAQSVGYTTKGSTSTATGTGFITGPRAIGIQQNKIFGVGNFSSLVYASPLPTTTASATTVFNPNSSALSFVFLDVDPTANWNSTGYDVLYIVNLSSGIEKYYWNGSVWTGLNTGLTSISPSAGISGITATVNNLGQPIIYAITGNGTTTNNSLVRIVDASGYNGVVTLTVNATSTIIATAGANYAFRGVALAPSTHTWNGSTSSDWNTSSNWSGSATVPTSGSTVYIPAPISSSIANTPSISAASSFTVSSLGINNTLAIGSTASLAINTTLNNGGTVSGQGKIVLSGTANQSLTNIGFLSNLQLNNSLGATVASGSNVNITSTLTPTLGELTTNGGLTLKSTSVTNTALVDVVGGNISGNVTIERFIPAKRAFRFLTPGVTSTSTIRTNWQEGQNNATTSSNSNNSAGFGTHITGSTTGATGFDATVTGAASLFTFDNTAQTWSGITNTSTNTLVAGRAYRLLVRGSRAVDLSNNTATADATVLRSTGALSIGTKTNTNLGVTLSAVANGYSFIGNPYWAPINWSTVYGNATNLNNSYWVWDPTLNGTNGRGSYVAWNGAATIANGSGTTSVNQYIQPGQAFFVQTTATSAATITFNESDKAVSQPLTNVFGRENNNSKTVVRAQLYLKNRAANADDYADAGTIVFSDELVKQNARSTDKFTNLDENIAIDKKGKLACIDIRAYPLQTDTIQLKTWQLLGNSYVLKVSVATYNETNIKASVLDKFLNKTYEVAIDNFIDVPFEITTDAASKAADRFAIVFANKAKPISPVDIVATGFGFSAKLQSTIINNQLQVNITNNEANSTIVRVFNELGQLVSNKNVGTVATTQVTMPTNKLNAGTYFVEVQSGSNKTTLKAIKQ